MIAKPATLRIPRAVSTTLSASRMCQPMRTAPQAGFRPASMNCWDIAASCGASAGRAGSSRYSSTCLRIARPMPQCSASGEGVENLLHVIVLLKLVDDGKHFGGLGLGQLARHGADVLMLGRNRRDASSLQCLLQVAEVGERAADDQLRLA